MSEINYETFKQEWLQDILSGNPSTVDLGNRFAKKIIANWLDFDENTDDIIFCDGSGDGGIDVACLIMDDTQAEGDDVGNTWYLVQSKHGSAFAGTSTILIEGQKILETLMGSRQRLSSLASDTIERIKTFIENAGPEDKLRLVYATHDPLTDEEQRGVAAIRTLGQAAFGDLFDVDSISIQTIYNRLMELESQVHRVSVPLKGNLAPSGNGLRVGAVGLLDLYEFLKQYKQVTGDLDQLYEKNVRKYLGGGRTVNKGIASTLLQDPEKFGLYNNGITIVAEDFAEAEGDLYTITEPYVVNGCQTTKTIWETLNKKLNSGASSVSSEIASWRERIQQGVVVVKLVKVGNAGESLLTQITRFTNSQNAVGRQDFISLESDFRTWSSEMAIKYNVYLEIHRGGWDSQKLLQRSRLSGPTFTKHANAFDLLKIYGAAWLAEPGLAFGKNPPFAPGGHIFKKIIDSRSFTVRDLYATYLLQQVANQVKFGRASDKQSRRQTRFLFYYVLVDMLKQVLITSAKPHTLGDLTEAVIKVFQNIAAPPSEQLTNIALNVIDNYMSDGNEDSVFTEPEFVRTRDLNLFLKWDKLGKGREFTPKFEQVLYLNKYIMSQQTPGQPSVKQIILDQVNKPN